MTPMRALGILLATFWATSTYGAVLTWNGIGAPIPGNPAPYPTAKTETAAWESSVNADFSQNVTTTLYYKGPALELPQGDYSGKVRLTVFVNPPATTP